MSIGCDSLRLKRGTTFFSQADMRWLLLLLLLLLLPPLLRRTFPSSVCSVLSVTGFALPPDGLVALWNDVLDSTAPATLLSGSPTVPSELLIAERASA